MEGFFIPDVLISGILERPGPCFTPRNSQREVVLTATMQDEVIEVRFVPQVSGGGATKGQVFYPSTSGLKGDLFFSFIALEKYW